MDFANIFGRRHYLLIDGMHSCAYIPRHTYRYLYRKMVKALGKNPEAENSLRFLWSHTPSGYMLAVNPDGVEMTRTHGLTVDSNKRVLIPCPYIQWILHAYGLEPEFCGRIYLEKTDIKGLAGFKLLKR